MPEAPVSREAMVEDYLDAYSRGDDTTCARPLAALFPDPGFPSDGPRVARWLATYIVQTKGRFAGKPLVCEPWQYDFLCEVYRLDPETGRRVYQEALLLLPRKNGKSTLVAGLALYHLVADFEAAPEVFIAAGSRDQTGPVFNQAKATAEASPALLDFVKPMRTAIVCQENGGSFKVTSSDAKLQHGSNPSAWFVDEKWGHKTNDITAAFQTGTDAREEPFGLTISTAGVSLEDTPLGEDVTAMLDRGRDEDPELAAACERLGTVQFETQREGFLTIVRDPVSGSLYWAYGPPIDDDGQPTVDLEDPEVWKACNPASWITKARLTQARRNPKTRLTDFRRFRLNVWTQDADYWLEQGAWKACGRDFESFVPLADFDAFGGLDPDARTDAILAALPEGWERPKAWAAVDIGVKRDRAAVALVRPRDEDGTTVFDVSVKVWDPPEEGAFDIATVRQYLRDIGLVVDLQEVAYDPWSFRESAQTLEDEGVPMVEFPQSNAVMCPASVAIFDAINTRRIRQSGSRTLAQHVGAGATTDTDRGWRLTKRKATKPIDALIALTMALFRALAHDPEEAESVYEGRGLLTLG